MVDRWDSQFLPDAWPSIGRKGGRIDLDSQSVRRAPFRRHAEVREDLR